MDPELKALLDAILARPAGRIRTALDYVKQLGPCLADGTCAAGLCGLQDAAAWTALIGKASETFVYADSEMGLSASVSRLDPSQIRLLGADIADVEAFVKSLKTPTPSSILDFECIITSTKQDHDGDILETDGADLDPAMPLLWQHIPMQPIGKFVAETKRTKKNVKGHFAIADIPLGRDAAVLVEFGALRISHGFKPLKYEPLERTKKDEEQGTYPGYHVLRFKVLETSLVSVPSNDDAVITATMREKLTHPLVKAWGKQLFDLRVKSTPGWTPPTPPAPPAPAPTPAPAGTKDCRCGDGIKGRMGKGDLEKLSSAIEHCKSAKEHADTPKPAATLITKAHDAIEAVHGRHKAGEDKGDKPAKRVTKADRAKLTDAVDHLGEAKKHEGMGKGPSAYCEKAHALCKEVVDRHQPANADEEEADEREGDKRADFYSTRTLALILAGETPNLALLSQLKSACQDVLEREDRRAAEILLTS